MVQREIIDNKRGVLTVALGDAIYVEMAKNLSRSIALNSPPIAKAIITDSDDDELNSLFDYVIKIKEEQRKGIISKFSTTYYHAFWNCIYFWISLQAGSRKVKKIRAKLI